MTLRFALLTPLARDLPRSNVGPIFSSLMFSAGPHCACPTPPIHSSPPLSQHRERAAKLPVMVAALEKRPVLVFVSIPTALSLIAFSLAVLSASPDPVLLNFGIAHRTPPTYLHITAMNPIKCPRAGRSLPGCRRGWHITFRSAQFEDQRWYADSFVKVDNGEVGTFGPVVLKPLRIMDI